MNWMDSIMLAIPLAIAITGLSFGIYIFFTNRAAHKRAQKSRGKTKWTS